MKKGLKTHGRNNLLLNEIALQRKIHNLYSSSSSSSEMKYGMEQKSILNEMTNTTLNPGWK